MPHSGVILVDMEVLGRRVQKVPVFIALATEFRRMAPGLLGTNVLRVSLDALHGKHGRRFILKVRQKSKTRYSVLKCVNDDGAW